MTDRSVKMLAELNTMAQYAFKAFLSALDSKLGDNQYFVFEGRRSIQVQEAYFAQGRQSLSEVNVLREKAGLYLLRNERDNYTITWTLKSKHIDGLAMDVLPVDGAGNPTWDLVHYRLQFEVIKMCAKAEGLICGADWVPSDWPHYEYNQKRI